MTDLYLRPGLDPQPLPIDAYDENGRIWTDLAGSAEGREATGWNELAPAKPVFDPATQAVTWDGSAWAVSDLPPPEPTVGSRPITFKNDVWRRCSEEQAGVIDTELTKLGTRQRRMWEDAQYLDHADPLVMMLKAQMTAAFGESEAARILAPSE